jgi:hypothetical protein
MGVAVSECHIVLCRESIARISHWGRVTVDFGGVTRIAIVDDHLEIKAALVVGFIMAHRTSIFLRFVMTSFLQSPKTRSLPQYHLSNADGTEIPHVSLILSFLSRDHPRGI